MNRLLCGLTALCLLSLTASTPVRADWFLDDAERLRLFGDARGRFEADFNSHDETGTARDDRDRLRYRIRLGLQYRPSDRLRFQFRARTTREASQQSSALTIKDLSGGDRDEFRLFPDQWFAEYDSHHTRFWLGRNTYPFWQANPQEMVWADNATIMGIFGSLDTPGNGARFGIRAGYFGLPDGMYDVAGMMGAVQASFVLELKQGPSIKAAAGLLAIDGTDRSKFLIDGNGERDYRIGMLSGEIRQPLNMDYGPDYVSLGLDLLHNLEPYSVNDPDPVSADFRDERNALILSLTTGGAINKARGSRWEAGYIYAHIEKLALNAAYAQADWIRWGSGGQTQASDLRGHGFSVRYWFTDNIDIRARLYLVDAVATRQDGNRFRLDINYRF